MQNVNVKPIQKYAAKIMQGLKLSFNAAEVFLIGAILFKLLYFNFLIQDNNIMSLILVLSTIGAVFILIFWTFLFPNLLKTIFLVAIDIFITVVVVSDLVFYRYFNDVISMTLILSQASVVGSVKSSILNLLHISDVILFLDFIAFIPFLLYKGKNGKESIKRPFRVNLVKSFGLLVLGIMLFALGLSSLLKDQPNILVSFYDRVYIAQKVGILNFHGIDVYQYFSKGSDIKAVTEEDKAEINQFMLDKHLNKNPNPQLFGIGKGKNLMVIQVEALQEFVINAKINDKEITPNLNKLLKRSMYFNNYFCETAGGGTSDAEFLANVSMFPVKEGAVYIRYGGNDYVSLAKTMKKENYDSIVMHAYKAGFWNRSIMYKTLGFDEYFNRNDYNQDQLIGMGLSDKSFFKQSLAKLKTMKQPYYAFMITLSSHYPFNGDKQYYSPFDVSPYKDTLFGDYLESIHYADEALGEYIEALEKEGLLDNTVLALYGDHYAIPKDSKDALGEFLNIQMDDFNWVNHQKVPMLIHLPGDQNAGSISTVGGGIDFMPTILNIMGINSDAIPMMGQDLLNIKDGLVIMRHGYFRTNKYLSLTSEGVAFDANTGESYDINKLEKEKQATQKNLKVSDEIIENNLVKEVEKYLNEHKQ